MSAEGNDRFEIPKNLQNMAEAGLDQARKAFETFLETAQRTASTFEGQASAAKASAQEIGTRVMSYAEKNVHASLEHAQNLMKAKDVTEALKMHTQFVQDQMRIFTEQASEMGQTVAKAAMDAARPKS
jgi:phasin